MKRATLLIPLAATLLGAGARADTLSVTVRPDQTGVCLPLYVKGAPGQLVRKEAGQEVVVPGQAIALPEGGQGTVYLLPAAAQAGAQTWRREPAAAVADPFKLVEHPDGRLELTEEGKSVLFLNFGPQLKEGVNARYRRSDYIHPLYDPDGALLTDDFPKDHLHHRGLFWSWSEVKVGDKSYDPWTCIGMEARFKRWLARETGPACTVLGMENGWYLGDKSTVRETVWTWVYRSTPNGRLMDVSITLEAEDQPVPFRGRPDQGKGYGGFTLRFAPRRQPAVTTPEGRMKGDGVQIHAPWADYSGQFGQGDAFSGVAIFDHTRNPTHPTTWLTRYYGVLNPTWPALQWTTLEKGKPITLRYRLWIHRGNVTDGKVASAWAVYSQPPVVDVRP